MSKFQPLSDTNTKVSILSMTEVQRGKFAACAAILAAVVLWREHESPQAPLSHGLGVAAAA